MSYWVDGVSYLLQGSPTSLSSIFVYNGKIFSTGAIGGGIGVWKNQSNILSFTGTVAPTSSCSIYVYNKDIYTAGRETDAHYWKNGIMTNLPTGATSDALAILVTPRR